MRSTLKVILLLSWALWLGGMVTLILFVMRLFGTSRDIAVHSAPVLFVTFAVYQLIVGMICCASGTLLAVMNRRKSQAAFSLLLLASLALALVIRSWTAEMMTLDRSNTAQIARFQTLHHRSAPAYSSAALLLLISGIGWILTLSDDRRATPFRTAPETAAA